MSLPVPIEVLAPIAGIVAGALAGKAPDPVEAARAGLALGLAFVPVDELRAHLDEASRSRGDAVFETLKNEKFGSEA